MSADWLKRGTRIADLLKPACTGELPQEVWELRDGVAVVVADLDGEDVMLTVTGLPRQRLREPRQ